MKRPFVTKTAIDVRYAETDQMGVVHHSNYFIWFELGRGELIKEMGFHYADMEKDGVLSPVADIHASYKRPVHYGETVTIHTWVEHYDGLRVVYGYEVVNGEGVTCVTGSSTHVCVKKDTFRPIAIRKHFPAWHEAYLRITASE
ncbi:acyl-CoA thioesterase [Halalkalibacterium halodurans]|jgi:acyl-CoA thioester hydrolase|uniref:acyl-CoA thioesterase n=1 Tax=Halalkalibacterium halodurans TaxID=86665 RepID=UPI002AA9EA3C|nr:thioesterase family protein [Halalkalibacterium halodurans]MDY7222838.1 thioesterase family protein [Halalkalibacterium halodurans]MDY7242059.1 thioesterase family protein [Halalkalibacterium halodurans]